MGSFFIYFLFINTMMKESNAMSVLHTFSIKLADVSIKNNTSYVLITSPPFPLYKRVTTRHDCFFYFITRAYFLQQNISLQPCRISCNLQQCILVILKHMIAFLTAVCSFYMGLFYIKQISVCTFQPFQVQSFQCAVFF